jgi:AraC-like DNA-binding protein
MSPAFKYYRPSPMLADIVEAFCDWDVACGDAATTFTVKVPPGTSMFLVMQYRVPYRMDWRFGCRDYAHRKYQNFANHIRSGIVTVSPAGPLGVITACLKPEAAVRLLGAPIHEFADTQIELSSLFGAGEMSLLEEMLAEASDSAERVAGLETFLMRYVRPLQPNFIAGQGALLLRQNPSLSRRQLASKLDVSPRHLFRCFQLMFGTGPKQFARLARIEKVLTARRSGTAWSNIAYACGFADQAHMIHDFIDIVGQSPENFFRSVTACNGKVCFRAVEQQHSRSAANTRTREISDKAGPRRLGS